MKYLRLFEAFDDSGYLIDCSGTDPHTLQAVTQKLMDLYPVVPKNSILGKTIEDERVAKYICQNNPSLILRVKPDMIAYTAVGRTRNRSKLTPAQFLELDKEAIESWSEGAEMGFFLKP